MFLLFLTQPSKMTYVEINEHVTFSNSAILNISTSTA